MKRRIKDIKLIKWISKKIDNYKNDKIFMSSLYILLLTALIIAFWFYLSWCFFYSENRLSFIPAQDVSSWVSSLALLMTLPITLIGIVSSARNRNKDKEEE